MTKTKLDLKLQAWITARTRHRLSHAHVQMARELGMNPAKLGKIDNHDQEPWKLPLSEFIESLYKKRFGKIRPDVVKSIEGTVRAADAKKAARKARRARRAASAAQDPSGAGLQGPPRGFTKPTEELGGREREQNTHDGSSGSS